MAIMIWHLFSMSVISPQIHLDKKVPTGAGLGGGSSNAATALWAANQFSGGLATEEELQEWSGEIGSDIPFFFSHGAAYCTGRGEAVEDMASPIALDIPMVLVKPPHKPAQLVKSISGSTIVGIGSPDPPQFVYDDEEYQDVFLTDYTDPPGWNPYQQIRVMAERKPRMATLLDGEDNIETIGETLP
ncbi:unnamed protein product [Linum tenue]|uniref:GHMP kinase N-terminal domain-containing protein n=1 Tax=Linum tenue TaxID=586396 RepID=A0AAV0QX48_9ROSI|nr:unnamed protein product [Linum tenue]